jgi:hypothetical protein
MRWSNRTSLIITVDSIVRISSNSTLSERRTPRVAAPAHRLNA